VTLASTLQACAERIVGEAPGTLGPLPVSRAVADLGERLAARNLGLVRVADPAAFAWPGHWIAILGTAAGTERAVVLFGVPSGPIEAGDLPADGVVEIVGGYVIAPLDLHRGHEAGAYRTTTGDGTVVGLFTAPTAGAPCLEHGHRRVEVGRGLDGDRYATGDGTFSQAGRHGQDVTLIEAENLEHLAGQGVTLSPADARRNVVTRGVRLEGLVGRCFAIGDVVLHGARLAEPCAHLQRLTRPGVLRGLVHRGGIRADVLAGGELHLGDPIRPVAEEW
jgi:MOSC domain-containing protein YiiM